MTLKQFMVVIISLCIAIPFAKWVSACAGSDDYYDLYPNFFYNNVVKDAAFTPFYYTSYSQYFGGNTTYTTSTVDDDKNWNIDSLADQNILAWRKYSGNAASAKDIQQFLTQAEESDAKNVFNNIKTGARLITTFQQNSMVQWLLQTKNAEAARYIAYAKVCEPYITPLEGYWDDNAKEYKEKDRNTTGLNEVINEGLSLFNGSSAVPFIQWRYKFQLLRLCFYNKQYDKTQKLFHELNPKPGASDQMDARCIGCLAGALYKTHKNAEASYWYSRAFDLSDEMKASAHLSFSWACNGDITEALKLCKTSHEKSVLYLMKALHVYGSKEDNEALPDIKSAYGYDPTLRGINVTITREINKIEELYVSDKFAAPTVSSYTEAGWYSKWERENDSERNANAKLAQTRLNSLNEFVLKIAAEGKNPGKAQLYLSSAYLYFLMDDEANCKKQLDNATQAKMTNREKDVHDLVEVLYVIKKGKTITPETEASILPYLKEVENRGKKQARFSKAYTDIMVNVISKAYLAQEDTVKAIYALSRSLERNPSTAVFEGLNWHTAGIILDMMPPEKLEEVQAFVTKSNKSTYETWLTQNTEFSFGALKEIEGTRYIREKKFDKAVEQLQQVPQSMLAQTVLPDFLISHFKDSQDWNKSDSAYQYNKLQFAKKMAELQQKISSDPKDARSCYQYANALYNMSYYGKAHHAFDYYRSSTDDLAYFASPERKALPGFMQEYYSVSLPEKYYMQAYDNTTDKELKARCLFMTAKCWQKNVKASNKERTYFEMGDKEFYKKALLNPYFSRLKKEYTGTQTLNTAITNCSYLSDYIMKN